MGRRPDVDGAARRRARPVPQVRPPARARAGPGAGRADARAPLRGRHGARDAVGQPRRPAGGGRGRARRRARAAVGRLRARLRRHRGTCCAGSTWSTPTPPTTSTRPPGAAAHPDDAAQGRSPRRSRTSGCGRSRCYHCLMDGHDPRNVPAWMGMWSYVEQNFGVWTVPGGMGALAEAMTKRLAERGVTVLLGDHRPRPAARGRPGGRRSTPTPAPSTPTWSCARSTRAACRCWRRTSTKTMPAIPPVVCHLGLVGDVPGPAARGGAARRPDPGRAHQRHGARGRRGVDGARPRPALRGRRDRARPRGHRRARAGRGARRPLPARPGRGARPARRTACSGRAGRPSTASSPATPYDGVYAAGRARRGRRRPAVRRARRGRRRGADRPGLSRPAGGYATVVRRPA